MNLFTKILFVAMIAVGISACSESTDPVETNTTTYGTPVTVGGGQGRSYVVRKSDGTPITIGVAINAAGMSGFADPDAAVEHILSVPAEGASIGIEHISLDYNPKGHEPDSIYTLPHFDVHFYQISNTERDAIAPGLDTLNPPANAVAPNYADPSGFAVPRMGRHFVDVTSHEFHGTKFDKTFIYGYSKGMMIFLEPMVTIEYMLMKKDESAPIAQPAVYQRPGKYYPTSYRVFFNSTTNEYCVELNGLVKR